MLSQSSAGQVHRAPASPKFIRPCMAGIAGQLQQPVQDILAESVQVRPKRKRGQIADFFESVMCRDAVEHVEVYVCA